MKLSHHSVIRMSERNVMLYMQALMECYEKLEVENKQLKSTLTELEEWLKENIKLKPLQTTYFFEMEHKLKSISEIELNELKRVLNKIQELKEKYK